MAGRSSSISMVSAHRLFAPARPLQHGTDPALELDESDVIWGGGGSSSSSSSLPVDVPYGRLLSVSTPSKSSKPRAAASRDAVSGGGGGPASLPVNIPDWSKILGAEYGAGSAGAGRWPSDDRGDAYFDAGEVGGRQWVPPHEQLMCRERAAASFSVREGAGRTLKGRDLRRVRNAIWEKTGFQD